MRKVASKVMFGVLFGASLVGLVTAGCESGRPTPDAIAVRASAIALVAPGSASALNVSTPPAVHLAMGDNNRLTAVGLASDGSIQQALQSASGSATFAISAISGVTASSIPTLAANPSPSRTMVVMARTLPGSPNIIQRAVQSTPNGGYGSWTHEAADFDASTGAGLAAFGPTLIDNLGGRLEAFMIDVNGSVVENEATSAGSAAWRGSWLAFGTASPAVIGRSEPVLIRRADNKLQAFVRDAGNGLSYVTQTSADQWAGAAWASVASAVIVGTPAVALDGAGAVNAIAYGWGGDTTSGFAAWTFKDNGAGGWTWVFIDGRGYTSPVAVKDGDGRIHVFTVNASRHLQQNVQGAAGWNTTWTDVGGTLSSAPAAAANANGDIEIFARFDDNKLNRLVVARTSGNVTTAWAAVGAATWRLPAEDPPSPLGSVVTQHNDKQRTGANLAETVLNVGNVNPYQFGKLFTRSIDGYVYAQPLYVPNLTINSAVHNVLVVATMKNLIYFFDADDPAQSSPLRTIDLGASYGHYAVPIPNRDLATNLGSDVAKCLCQNTIPFIGITSTPVIDVASDRLYVVAFGSPTNQTRDLWTTDVDGSCPANYVAPMVGNCHTYQRTTPMFLYAHKLFSFALSTGTLQKSTDITPSFPCPATAGALGCGNGVPAGGIINFTSRFQLQRSGLLLSGGNVYVAFAANNDADPAYGWVAAFKADSTLASVGTPYVTVPVRKAITGDSQVMNLGGIWQSGEGPAADDSGNLYFNTGNGPFDAYPGGAGNDFGDSVIKLDSTLVRRDWFAPAFDYYPDPSGVLRDYPGATDSDLASGGVLLLPGGRALSGGKPGFFHLLDTANLGHFRTGASGANSAGDGNLQNVQATRSMYGGAGCDETFQFHFNGPQANIHGTPVFWDDPKLGGLVYVMGERDNARAFRYSFSALKFTGALVTSETNASSPAGCRCYQSNAGNKLPSYPCLTPESWSPDLTPNGMPGAFLSLSANSFWGGTGVVWAARPTSGDATKATVTGTLAAYDAQDLSKRLWISDQLPANGLVQTLGNFAKFVPPTIANGKVYMATFDSTDASNHIVVYGLYNSIH